MKYPLMVLLGEAIRCHLLLAWVLRQRALLCGLTMLLTLKILKNIIFKVSCKYISYAVHSPLHTLFLLLSSPSPSVIPFSLYLT